MIKETLRKLRDVRTDRCVSIFLPTHRTHPENRQDLILLRNLLSEAKERLVEECDSHSLPDMLSQLDELPGRIDPRYNLDGLAIFLNEDICEYVRLPIEVEPRVVLDETFATRDLLRALNQIEHYYILRLSENEAHLFGAYTDRIIDEYIIHGFPYVNELSGTNRHKEFLNRVDKGMQQDVVSDIVDELIEDQMRRQGKVSFLPDGFLEEWGRIGLKTRY